MAKIELTPQLATDPMLYSRLMGAVRPAGGNVPELIPERGEVYSPVFFQSPLTDDGIQKNIDFDDREKLNQENLLDSLDYLTPGDFMRVNDALSLMHYAHQEQKRESKDRYSNHCLRVANIIAQMKLDADTVISALLHDVLEDSAKYRHPVSADFIGQRFGFRVKKLVLGCRNSEWDLQIDPTTLRGYRAEMTEAEIRDLEKREYDRQTFLKIYRQFQTGEDTDPRIILLKLADRLDNMREIAGKQSPRKRQMKAVATLEISSNLAKLTGEDDIRNELSDLAFQEIDPRRFNYFADVLMKAADSAGDLSEGNLERYEVITNALEKVLQKDTLRQELERALANGNLHLTPDSIQITLPGIYGLYQTWLRRMEKCRFTSDDLYAKVFIPVAGLGQGHNLTWYERKIKNKLQISGWVTSDEYNPNSKAVGIGSREVIFTHPQLKKRIKVKIVSKSADETENARLAYLYKAGLSDAETSQYFDPAKRKLQRLSADYHDLINVFYRHSIGGIGDVSDTVLCEEILHALVTDMGGIRVYGIKPGEYTTLPAGATVADYAYRIRGGNMVHLDSFIVNGFSYTADQINRPLTDNDRIKFTIDDESDSVVTPIWLQATSDPKLLAVITQQMKAKLEVLKFRQSPIYAQWKGEIEEIGAMKFNDRLLYTRTVSLDFVRDYVQKGLDFAGISDFLQAVAYGEVREVDLDVIADEIDKYTKNTVAMDVAYRTINQEDRKRFKELCLSLDLPFKRTEDEFERGPVRYFFDIKHKVSLAVFIRFTLDQNLTDKEIDRLLVPGEVISVNLSRLIKQWRSSVRKTAGGSSGNGEKETDMKQEARKAAEIAKQRRKFERLERKRRNTGSRHGPQRR